MTQLWSIIEEYLRNYRPDIAMRLATSKCGPEDIHFGWAGSLKVGEGHYYGFRHRTF